MLAAPVFLQAENDIFSPLVFRINFPYYRSVQRSILHIDFDSFFASVEQQTTPHLRNKPIGVTATNGRNCIIAASREAKRFGITSPGRTFEAQKICPSLIIVPAHFVQYWEVSKKFVDICKDYSPFVEIFSIDEVFMDVTQTAKLFGGVSAIVEKIRNRLRNEIGEYITASFGISYNKLLAKLASGLRKPNGLMEIKPHEVAQVYQTSKLTAICGIGNRIAQRLEAMGIRTPLHLRFIPLSALIAEFGEVEGKFLHDIGLGIDERPVVPYTQKPEVKSVSRNYCLPHNEYDKRKILQNIYELCEEVALKLRRLNKTCRTVGIYLRGKQTVHGRETFGEYLDDGQKIFEGCLSILDNQNKCHCKRMQSGLLLHALSCVSRNDEAIPHYVRQIGVWAGNLEDNTYIPESLFFADQRKKHLQKVIDSINEKFGDHTIRNGFLLNADKLTTVPNGYLADKYERIKLAETSAG